MKGNLAVAVLIVLCSGLSAEASVDIETVYVGNAGNAPDTRYNGISIGGVDYTYLMGKFEVTASQYTEFLNAIAHSDPYYLYHYNMSTVYGCGIIREGDPGAYTYSVSPGYENRPVNNITWAGAARFANWLHNGQPIGTQSPLTTEDGSYFLNGALTNQALTSVVREPDATWVIPSQDEWYKAAHHYNDGVTGNYYDYQTSSDVAPGTDMAEATNPGNNANYGGDGITPIDPPYFTTQVGEFELSESPYGTFDQAGNVAEWNEEAYYSEFRGLRGSGYSGGGAELLHAEFFNAKHPTTVFSGFGARLALVPEPGTLMLLIPGVLLLGVRRRMSTRR